ncbi:MAG TPA: biotin--[acetyl-CoA-carboxylase] ligase [Burkholderiales bacterium]|nr:biotin--[acetyl-CoA-carboxylase] ligase [Burkholderiales bacterium]
MDRLDAAQISLPGVEIQVVERCPSTNTALLKRNSDGPTLLAAEEQTAGRGRRGRRWHSPAGAGVTFSLAARVRRPLREMPALSLVAGVAASRALRSLGVAGAALKWPNDLVVDGAKLGGILVETRANGAGCHAVIGIGINCHRVPQLEAKVGRELAFVDDHARVSRNGVIQEVAGALLHGLREFESRGLDAVRADWEAMHAHAGQRLRVRLADGRVITGIASGLGENGALQIKTRQGLRAVTSGRVVSARAA